ncbi:MAG: hypothetical protein Q8P20_05030 [bacterium]|nr:hypothetical protein [bacterium]
MDIHLLDSDLDLTVVNQVKSNCGKDILSGKAVHVTSINDSICGECLDIHTANIGRRKQFTYAIVEDFPN